ncbi:MAG: hypothetical protein H6742_14350 [Alphaproteobacteria bacterium]|nr:hypothetical protein [Alphaproteobacteria bacterium]
MHELSARATTEWRDFTPQHRTVREQALATAMGTGAHHVAAVVGVYGSGKSTLLFDVLRQANAAGHMAIWDESAAFFERVLRNAPDKVRSEDFVRMALTWVRGLRSGSELDELREDLSRRGRSDVVDALPSTPTTEQVRVVLLLDEMEQAHEMLRDRVQTDDGNPLRSFLDAAGPSLGIVVAYAPESFHALGDAERGRHTTLRVPVLAAAALANQFEVTRGAANFAWWASRGRARGAIQAVERVVRPYGAGQLAEPIGLLRDVLDDLPPVFGVPAVLHDHLDTGRLEALLHLKPSPCPEFLGVQLDTRNPGPWTREMEERLVRTPGDDRRATLALLREVTTVLEAIADEDGVAYVPIEEIPSLVDLSIARAQESGSVAEVAGAVRDGLRLALQASSPALLSRRLSFTVAQLGDEVFPSPFTDPVLPFDGRQPTMDRVVEAFAAVARGRELLATWERHRTYVFHDETTMESWLRNEETEVLRGPVKALLVKAQGPLGAYTRVCQEAGILRVEATSPFTATFLQSAVVALDRISGGLTPDLDQLTDSNIASTRDLGRKVRWHLERLETVVRSMRPSHSAEFERAVSDVENHLLPFLQTRRLQKDSTGLLALVQVLETPSAAGAQLLAEVAGVFSSERSLRKLTARSRYLAGAGVVVDDLLPSRGGASRWLEGGHGHLRGFVRKHSDDACVRLLARLLAPGAEEAMEVVLRRKPPAGTELEPTAGVKSVSRLGRVAQRIDAIHVGLGELLEEAPDRLAHTMNLGDTLNLAVKARPDADALERIIGRLEDVQEEWVRVLVTWLIHQFIEVVISVVGESESALREWEKAATRGRDVGARVAQLQTSLRDRGWNKLAGRVDAVRAHVRSRLDDPSTLLTGIEQLADRVAGYEALAEELRQLKDVATEHGLDCDRLLGRYDPREDDPRKDAELVGEVAGLLDGMSERLPAPRGDLRAWLVSLRDHLTKSRDERLRARLGEVLGDRIAQRVRKVYEDHVVEIEDAWGNLAEGFQRGVQTTLEASQHPSSDALAAAVNAAIERQALFAGRRESGDVRELDEALEDLAQDGDSDVGAVRREIEAREDVLAWLASSATSLAPKDVLLTVLAQGRTYAGAFERATDFEAQAQPLWDALRAALPPDEQPSIDESEDPDAFLHELRRARDEAEAERAHLLSELTVAQDILRCLGDLPRSRSASSTIDAIRAELKSAEAEVARRLGERETALVDRAAGLGVSVDPISTSSSGGHLGAIQRREALLDEIQGVADDLRKISGEVPLDPPVAIEAAHAAYTTRLLAARAEMTRLRSRLEGLVLRMRLFRIDAADAESALDSQDLAVLRQSSVAAGDDLRGAVATKEAALSDEARETWRQLRTHALQDPILQELLSAGLLVPADPEGLE